MSKALKNYSTKVTPQSEPIPGKDMVENSAGGFVFTLDKWDRLTRFLILGTDGGTYYISERNLTKQNIAVLSECLKEDGIRMVETITEVSTSGRAPKNDPAIFALAYALSHGDTPTRQLAAEKLSSVCRIGTHLFQFVGYLKNMGGIGPVKRRALASWYHDKSPDNLAYQMVKYRQREGFTHHDVLHLCHAKPQGQRHNELFFMAKEMAHGKLPVLTADTPKIVESYNLAQVAKSEQEIVNIIADNPNLPREAIPTEYVNSAAVQEALLPSMPITALLRNLGNLSKSGLLAPFSNANQIVIEKITNEEFLRKGRVHPISVLLALTTYSAGRGVRGSGTWNPLPQIVDALNEAFYLAFGAVDPIGNNVMLALDVSSSMHDSRIANTHLSAAVGSCAMAMVTARTEPNWMITAFTNGTGRGSGYSASAFSVLGMSPTERLDDLVARTSRLGFGGTDCALPMLMATQENWPIDTFIIYTDHETWFGGIHPTQALEQYRQKSGRNAKLIVVGMTSNDFTIADPSDSGMLDVVGFDGGAPSVISSFARTQKVTI